MRVLLLEMVNLPFGMRPKAAAQPQQSGYLNDNEAVVRKLIHSFIHVFQSKLYFTSDCRVAYSASISELHNYIRTYKKL